LIIRHDGGFSVKRDSAAWFVALGLVLGVKTASAAPCAGLPNPIYGLGGSAQQPLVGALATELSKQNPATTIVYDSSKGACSGINGLYGPTPTKMTGTAAYWSADGTQGTCDLPIAGESADFGTLGNSATLCPNIPSLPAEIGDFRGPVTAVNVFVPKASSQQSISAEGLYFVYGFGATGQAAPWTDESVIIRRNQNSFVQIFIGLAAGIPVTKFKGIDAGTNQNSVNLVVATPALAEKAIGFASSQTVDDNRDVVRSLAYQHTGQSCGYWPDSTADAFDKQNVRSGQYYLWSRLHFLAKVDGTGKVADPETAKVIGYFTESLPPPGAIDYTKLVIDNGAIPDCAMRAQREGDLGALASYAPTEPCGCYFDYVATGATTCAACSTGSPCAGAGEQCRHGYCEAY
jgi:ABC-type phosphate transport system substrate-binding protein